MDHWKTIAEYWPVPAAVAGLLLTMGGWLAKKLVVGVTIAWEWAKPLVENWFAGQAKMHEAFPQIIASQTAVMESLQLSQALLRSLVEMYTRDDPRSRKIVLLVEDNYAEAESFRARVAAFLESHRARLTVVTRIADAIPVLQDTRVCVLDIGTPDSTLLSTTREFIVHAAQGCRAKVIVFTGRDMVKREDVPAALDVIHKDDWERLLAALERAFE